MSTRIIIIGGGFAGIQTLFNLRSSMKRIPYEATLISDKKFFSFTPFLAEVAGDVIPPIEAMTSFKYIIRSGRENFIHGKVTKIDLEKKIVYIGEREYSYRFLVIAIGSTSNFLHIPGAKEHTFVLKNVADANMIKTEVNNIYKIASKLQNTAKQKKLLTCAIIGGGATGIEIASGIKEHIDNLLATSYSMIDPSFTNVILVSGGKEIAKEFDETIRKKAAEFMRKENITLKLNARVKEVQTGKIILTDNTEISAHFIIWAAGVKPNEMIVTPEDVIHPHFQKFIVNENLQLPSYPEVFAVGDVAMYTEGAKQLPMLAQVAVSEGKYVGKTIASSIRKKPLHRFSYSSKGGMISIGRGEGVATIFGIDVTGKLAWLIWKVVYFMKFIDTRKKPLILKYWIKEFFNIQ